MLYLDDWLIWDFWTVDANDAPDGRYHAFFLQAPRRLPDPEMRHVIATVGHAVSPDLRAWTYVGTAFAQGAPGAFDDRAIWTGSIVRADDRFWLFYTGISTADAALVQRIGAATSRDLLTWERVRETPLLEADPRWYAKTDGTTGEDWRDPWVVRAGDEWRMYVTASVPSPDRDGKGVVGFARSRDLVAWEALPPVSAPGEVGELEVPQLLDLGDRCALLFCTAEQSATNLARTGSAGRWMGAHYLLGPSPAGPFAWAPGPLLLADAAGTWYAPRAVRDLDGRRCLMAWRRLWDDGSFCGALSDPAPLTVGADGSLRVDPRALWRE